MTMGDSTLRELDRALVDFVRRRTGNRQVARDITQQVWLAAWRFRGESSARHFLFTVARRQVAEWFRSRQRSQVTDLEHLPEDLGLLALDTPLSTRVERAEQIRRLRAALFQVPQPFQRALRLRLAGMDNAEVAAAMGCSPNTARSRLYRGRQALLAVLTKADAARAPAAASPSPETPRSAQPPRSCPSAPRSRRTSAPRSSATPPADAPASSAARSPHEDAP